MKNIVNKIISIAVFSFFIVITIGLRLNSYAANEVLITRHKLNSEYGIPEYLTINGESLKVPVKGLYQQPTVAVYCLEKTKTTPYTDDWPYVTATSDSLPNGASYILNNGVSSLTSSKPSEYLVGDLMKDYYITHVALNLYLAKKGYYYESNQLVLGVENQSQSNDTARTIQSKILKLVNDAISYDNSATSPNTPNGSGSGSLSISTTKLNIAQVGNKFVSNSISATVTNGKNNTYKVSVSGVSEGSYKILNASGVESKNGIFTSGESFKIEFDGNKLQYGKYDVSVDISAEFLQSSYGITVYKHSKSTIQKVGIVQPRTTNGQLTATKTASGSFTYCNTSTIKGEWIQSKNISIDGYNIKNGNNHVGSLEINKKYSLTSYVKYVYGMMFDEKEVDSNPAGCAPRPLPDRPANGNYSGTIYYDIKYKTDEDKTIQGEKGNFEKVDFKVDNTETSYTESKKAPSVEFTVPNEKGLIEAEITLTLKDPSGNEVDYKVIKLPIKWVIDDSIAIKALETNFDECTDIIRSSEVSLKAIVESNDIKTKNLDVKFQVKLNNGEFKDIVESKTAYGASRNIDSVTYTKYKIPETIGKVSVSKVQFKVIMKDNPSSFKLSKSFNVLDSLDPQQYEKKGSAPMREYSLSSSQVVTYLKVEKRDKTKEEKFSHEQGCQKNDNGSTFCPGDHIRYVFGEYYPAFVLKQNTKIENIKETMEITSIQFRSKYTKENKGTQPIKSDGYIELKGLSANNYKEHVKLKAGYGFEMKISTKYTNNIPNQIQKVDRSNQIPESKMSFTEYKVYSGQSPVALAWKNVDATVKPYLTNKTPVMIVAPAADELPYDTLNQVYIKMPDGSYLYKSYDKKGLDITNGAGKELSSEDRDNPSYGETFNNSEIIRVKNFEFTSKAGERKYYLHKDIKSGMFSAKVFTPLSGIKLSCNDNNMPRESVDIQFNVYGGYTDDLKTHLNE